MSRQSDFKSEIVGPGGEIVPQAWPVGRALDADLQAMRLAVGSGAKQLVRQAFLQQHVLRMSEESSRDEDADDRQRR